MDYNSTIHDSCFVATALQFSSWKTRNILEHLIDNCDLCIRSEDGSTIQAELFLDQSVHVTCPPGAVPKQYHCGKRGIT